MQNKDKLLIELSKAISGTWTIPILASINIKGDRFTPLQTRIGASPARLSENLKRLCEEGLVHHIAPGDRRHPLLPEYVLTEKGMLYREIALAVYKTNEAIAAPDAIYKQWNLPILFTILNKQERFQQIKHELNSITSKMLSGRLLELQGNRLVDKAIVSVSPIIPKYSLTETAYKPINNLAQDIISLL